MFPTDTRDDKGDKPTNQGLGKLLFVRISTEGIPEDQLDGLGTVDDTPEKEKSETISATEREKSV